MSFAVPVLEEVVFTGSVVNAIAKPYGFVTAVVGVPMCFGLVHVFQFGVGRHLVPVFFAGVTYVAIRVFSGSLLLAVLAHCVVNAVILLPKWVVAVIRFSQA
jgi:membrane protease YdiL (CAAX protease family)